MVSFNERHEIKVWIKLVACDDEITKFARIVVYKHLPTYICYRWAVVNKTLIYRYLLQLSWLPRSKARTATWFWFLGAWSSHQGRFNFRWLAMIYRLRNGNRWITYHSYDLGQCLLMCNVSIKTRLFFLFETLWNPESRLYYLDVMRRFNWMR